MASLSALPVLLPTAGGSVRRTRVGHSEQTSRLTHHQCYQSSVAKVTVRHSVSCRDTHRRTLSKAYDSATLSSSTVTSTGERERVQGGGTWLLNRGRHGCSVVSESRVMLMRKDQVETYCWNRIAPQNSMHNASKRAVRLQAQCWAGAGAPPLASETAGLGSGIRGVVVLRNAVR